MKKLTSLLLGISLTLLPTIIVESMQRPKSAIPQGDEREDFPQGGKKTSLYGKNAQTAKEFQHRSSLRTFPVKDSRESQEEVAIQQIQQAVGVILAGSGVVLNTVQIYETYISIDLIITRQNACSNRRMSFDAQEKTYRSTILPGLETAIRKALGANTRITSTFR